MLPIATNTQFPAAVRDSTTCRRNTTPSPSTAFNGRESIPSVEVPLPTITAEKGRRSARNAPWTRLIDACSCPSTYRSNHSGPNSDPNASATRE